MPARPTTPAQRARRGAGFADGWATIGATFTGGGSHRAIACGPLATLAVTIAATWLALLLYIDAYISPADAGLIHATLSARPACALGRNGNAPRSLARVNKTACRGSA